VGWAGGGVIHFQINFLIFISFAAKLKLCTRDFPLEWAIFWKYYELKVEKFLRAYFH
jgi:hypothetical protein